VSAQDIFLKSSADAGDKSLVGAEPPGKKFDMTHWKLQTCVKDPKEVEYPKLKEYKDEKHFKLDGDYMVMRVPDKGETYSSSDPREELREVGHSWKGGHGKHELHATLMVHHVSHKVTIAQVHGESSKSDPRKLVLMLQYKNETVFANVRDHKSPHNTVTLEMGHVKLNHLFTYSVKLDGSKMDITVNGKHVSHEPPYMDADHYFKAGAYSQCRHCKDSDDYVEVRFKQLSTKHG